MREVDNGNPDRPHAPTGARAGASATRPPCAPTAPPTCRRRGRVTVWDDEHLAFAICLTRDAPNLRRTRRSRSMSSTHSRARAIASRAARRSTHRTIPASPSWSPSSTSAVQPAVRTMPCSCGWAAPGPSPPRATAAGATRRTCAPAGRPLTPSAHRATRATNRVPLCRARISAGQRSLWNKHGRRRGQMELDGAVALVTGGTGGLGSRICHALARAGCHVVVAYNTSHEAARALADELTACTGSGRCRSRPTCPTRQRSPACSRRSRESFGGLDILVNNAAANRWVPYPDLDALTPELWGRTAQPQPDRPLPARPRRRAAAEAAMAAGASSTSRRWPGSRRPGRASPTPSPRPGSTT